MVQRDGAVAAERRRRPEVVDELAAAGVRPRQVRQGRARPALHDRCLSRPVPGAAERPVVERPHRHGAGPSISEQWPPVWQETPALRQDRWRSPEFAEDRFWTTAWAPQITALPARTTFGGRR